ncbi:Autophagy-related protein 27 [Mycena sanguinolenta]|uniref:Autophagy-related protein 27 n=1 Tax=Mycena sanguinolenta TaxID=230812 RepID=A0A8H6YAC8_9AGAR|nr:Autophagy-related protein 27 [Mycena sanguinolenta]
MLAATQILLAAAAAAKNYSCSFTLDSLEFDLCPLYMFSGESTSISFAEETPPTLTTQRYDLGAPLKPDTTLPAKLQCPEGTWICLTVENTRPDHDSEPMRILQVVPVARAQGLNPKAKMLSKVQADDLHEPLQITLHGGLYNDRSQMASFEFHCDHSSDEPTLPKLSWQWNGTHAFKWITKHACPRALPPGAPPGPKPEEPDPDPPAEPPDNPDSDVDDREPTTHPSLTWTFFISLFWISIIIIGLRFLYPLLLRWGQALRSRLPRARNPMARTTGFRPSPVSLVQWAREEAPAKYDTDDVFMHGFSDGEETPLTPNSRASFVVSQYGSAGYSQ